MQNENEKNSLKHIVLTGGGTAGHVMPNLALVPALKEAKFQISYIGSINGMEKSIVEEADIPYFGIETGKLRRYLSAENIKDAFRVVRGIRQAKQTLRELNPSIIFSKGGFVSVPVAIAAKSLNIPLIVHEADLTPGLANKISIPRAQKVCCNFPETLDTLPKEKAVLTGCPIREELLCGNALEGAKFAGFLAQDATDNNVEELKPTLLVIGGSLGAAHVNEFVRNALSELLQTFNVVHVCGKGKLDASFEGTQGYKQFEYVGKELPHLYALANVAITRGGANSLFELLALQLPSLIIPLSKEASRGDQILNAKSFEKSGYAKMLEEEEITFPSVLIEALQNVYENRETYRSTMSSAPQNKAIENIMCIIQEYA